MGALQSFLTSVTIHQSKRRDANIKLESNSMWVTFPQLTLYKPFVRDILILQTPLEWLLPIRPPVQNLQRLRDSTKLE